MFILSQRQRRIPHNITDVLRVLEENVVARISVRHILLDDSHGAAERTRTRVDSRFAHVASNTIGRLVVQPVILATLTVFSQNQVGFFELPQQTLVDAGEEIGDDVEPYCLNDNAGVVGCGQTQLTTLVQFQNDFFRELRKAVEVRIFW